MGHHLDPVQAGGTGLRLHVRDEQASDAPSLRLVGDEQQIELRWSEDERVEPEDPASLVVASDGDEHAVGLDVVRTDPVARDRSRELPLVRA